MSRLRPLVFFGALFLWVGCTQADGEPCDIDRDCGSSSICCGDGRLPDFRGICQSETETCEVRPERDAGVVEDAGSDGVDDAGADGGIVEDAGADAGQDEDAGTDAGTAEDAGTDAGSADAGSADGGVDAGADAGA